MSQLARKLGISSDLSFYDVLDIDDQEGLLSFIPRPVHALIFLTPASVYHATRDDTEAEMRRTPDPQRDLESKPPAVTWFKQTVGNACGLMAFLHCICNGVGRNYIEPDSQFAHFLKEADSLPAASRADLVYNSELLEQAHMDVAFTGDTDAPITEGPAGFHYIAFVKSDDGHLWELNGGMPGPLDLGALSSDEGALSPRALDMSVRSFMGTHPDLRHSIVALGPTAG